MLYLALEDTEARLQRRSARMFRENGSDRLHFAIAVKTIGSGLLEQLVEDVQTQIIPRLSKSRIVATALIKVFYADDYISEEQKFDFENTFFLRGKKFSIDSVMIWEKRDEMPRSSQALSLPQFPPNILHRNKRFAGFFC